MKAGILCVSVTIVLFCMGVSISMAQTTVTSKASGLWSDVNTWDTGLVPSALDSVVIRLGDSVSVFTGPAACNSLTVDGILTDTVSLASSLTVTNIFTLSAGARLHLGSTLSEPPGVTRTIDNSSYIRYYGTQSTIGSSTFHTFGTLELNRNAGISFATSTTINGDLICTMAGNGNSIKGTTSTSGSQTHTVVGNVYLYGGQLVAVDVGSSSTVGIWNINGNVLVTSSLARFGPFSSASSSGLGIFNIAGNLTIDNAARFQAGSSSTAGTGTGIINLSRDLTFTSTATINSNNRIGAFAINFVGTEIQNVTNSMPSAFSNQSPLYDTVGALSTVSFNTPNGWGQTGAAAAGYFVVEGSLYAGSNFINGIQNVEIKSGATVGTQHTNGLNGNLTTTGIITASKASNFVYNGYSTQVTGSFLPDTVNNLTMNNPAGVTLSNKVVVTGSCAVAPGTYINESSGKYIIGTATAMQNVGTGAVANIGGLGVGLDLGPDDVGYVSLVRFSGSGAAVSNGSKTTINRVWYLNADGLPSNGRNLTLSWDALDDNGKDLTTAQVWESIDYGSSWFRSGAQQDVSSTHSITIPITSFSEWTVSDAVNPLPVEMSSFMAETSGINAILTWKTISETNNFGFEVERRAIPNGTWNKIVFVAGAGTRTSPQTYSFEDKNLTPGNYAFRIKQIDNDGTWKYSETMEIEILGMPKVLKLSGNYPNPFNPTTKIEFTVPENGHAKLRIYNILGQEVANLFDGPVIAGTQYSPEFHALGMPSGLYFSVLEFGNKRLTGKMVLAK